MVREQVRQEAERLADSLGLTMDELYHAPLKDILQVLRRHQREEDSEEELEDEESEDEESEEELQEDQLEEEQLEDEELMIMIKGLAEAGYIPKKYVDDAHDLFFVK